MFLGQEPEVIPPVIQQLILESGGDAKAALLSGGSSGKVYRIRDNKSGKAVDVKLYNPAIWPDETRLKKDAEGLRTLAALLDPKIVKIPTIKHLDDEKIIFESNYGITFENYMKNPDIPLEWKQKKLRQYNNAVAEIKSKLFQNALNKGYKYSVSAESTYIFHGVSVKLPMIVVSGFNYRMAYFIKPDNMLVEPSGTLTLIDPY